MFPTTSGRVTVMEMRFLLLPLVMYMVPPGNIPGNHTIFAFSHDSLNSLKTTRENSKYQVMKVLPGPECSGLFWVLGTNQKGKYKFFGPYHLLVQKV